MTEMTLIEAAVTGGTVVGVTAIVAVFLYHEIIRQAKKEAREVVKDKMERHKKYKHD